MSKSELEQFAEYCLARLTQGDPALITTSSGRLLITLIRDEEYGTGNRMNYIVLALEGRGMMLYEADGDSLPVFELVEHGFPLLLAEDVSKLVAELFRQGKLITRSQGAQPGASPLLKG